MLPARVSVILICAALSMSARFSSAQPCEPPSYPNSCGPCHGVVRAGCRNFVAVSFDLLCSTTFSPHWSLYLACSRGKVATTSDGRTVFSSVGDCDCNGYEGGIQFDKTCDAAFVATRASGSSATTSADLGTDPIGTFWIFPATDFCANVTGSAASVGQGCDVCPPSFYQALMAGHDLSLARITFRTGYEAVLQTGQKHCLDNPNPSPYFRGELASEDVNIAASLQKCTSYSNFEIEGGGSLTTLVQLSALWQRGVSPCGPTPAAPEVLKTLLFRKRLRLTLSDGTSQFSVIEGAVTSFSNGQYVREGVFDSMEFVPSEQYDGEGNLTGSNIFGSRYVTLDTGTLPQGVYITSVCEAVAPLPISVNLDLDMNDRIDACDRKTMYRLLGTQDQLACISADEFPIHLDFDGDGFVGQHDVLYYVGQFNSAAGCNRVDWNCDGVVNPDDIGDFITYYFSDPPSEPIDYNDDFVVNPDDLGDYITEYFACQ